MNNTLSNIEAMNNINGINASIEKHEKHMNLISFPRDAIMTIIILWLLCPYQAFFANWYIYGVLWCAWIVFALLANSKAFLTTFLSIESLVMFSWPITNMILFMLDWSNFSLYQFTIPLFLLSFSYYARSKSYKPIKFFVVIGYIYLAIIFIYSIIILQANREIARILASSDKNITSQYAGVFVANFSSITNAVTTALLCLFGLKMYKSDMNRAKRILYELMFVISGILLWEAQYSIAIINFLLCSIIILWLDIKKHKTNYVKSILGIILFLFMVFYAGSILIFISENIEYGYVSRRLESIGQILSSGEIATGTDMEERLNLYFISIDTFFSNFFFGVGGNEYMANGIVGGHSSIIDNYAYYGVIFGTQFVIYLITIIKNNKRYLYGSCSKIYSLLGGLYVYNCIINTCYTEEILFFTSFIIPAVLYTMQNKYSENEGSS